ncbi:hypothetical protein AF72_01350 [Xylella taiwanensis]|uniref:Uncharacterized protein n=1 Tax=Xylella taiwanensis TaxID=1444770 RepID=Z9JN66_9GAMM|nr:hypothetical protein AB672_05015 [Xylella taiwanensis]EWS79246.1 hypothetical protein AF72_01350 [Xylella taiwanensis]
MWLNVSFGYFVIVLLVDQRGIGLSKTHSALHGVFFSDIRVEVASAVKSAHAEVSLAKDVC